MYYINMFDPVAHHIFCPDNVRHHKDVLVCHWCRLSELFSATVLHILPTRMPIDCQNQFLFCSDEMLRLCTKKQLTCKQWLVFPNFSVATV